MLPCGLLRREGGRDREGERERERDQEKHLFVI